MAIDKEENHQTEAVVVEHFYSPVVEVISLLSSYVNPTRHEFAEETHQRLSQELSKDTKEFIDDWKKITDWDFMELLNFILPCPYFNDMKQFLQKLSHLSDEEYIYHLLSEYVPMEQVKQLVKNPDSIKEMDVTIWWETAEKRNFMISLLTNIEQIRAKTSMILLEIEASNTFKHVRAEHMQHIEKSMTEVKALKMQPLNLAQYVMGKTFRRTSLYKMYMFIPSYFFTPHRMRVFNNEICIVVYGCATPLSDSRETSKQLEVKLKALSDQNRLLILNMLSGRKEYGAKLAEYLGITTATVSHHLEILKKAEFITEEKVGNIKYFTSNMAATEDFLHSLKQFIHIKN
jgi:DNA-binding transcriptional ArsR family regulator